MDNQFSLTATLHKVMTLRYTPSGTSVLEVILQHESIQYENDKPCQIKFELAAKIIGSQAPIWQHQQGEIVHVTGFISQYNQRSVRPILRIQNITKYKG